MTSVSLLFPEPPWSGPGRTIDRQYAYIESIRSKLALKILHEHAKILRGMPGTAEDSTELIFQSGCFESRPDDPPGDHSPLREHPR